MESKVLSNKYEQTLFKIVNPVSERKRKGGNKAKSWEYGYNEEFDFVCISKDGTLGEVYEIQGLQIGLPEVSNVYSRSKDKDEQYWEILEGPNDRVMKSIQTVAHFKQHNDSIQEIFYDFIDKQFEYREKGFFFMCNGKPKYITGGHYMYLQWSKIDIGKPHYREANTLFFYFWEACKADDRSYGMCYLKNRRSGFSFMSAAETVHQATIKGDSRFGVLSKTGADAKQLFVGKIVPISSHYPFFFKPIQDGMDRPKTELAYRVPASRLTKKSLLNFEVDEIDLHRGLDTSIDWKNTGDYSYDGEKLRLLVQDESGKWLKPDSILNNWGVTKTCLRLGRRIVGKCMMGSTSGALDKGGNEFKQLYTRSDLRHVKRNKNGETPTGLYSLFIPMEWNFEGYFDKFGYPIFNDPEEPVVDNQGFKVDRGVITHWENEVDGLKSNQDAQNEYYRQFPRHEKHAFRDEATDSLFNLVKLYQQIDYNEGLKNRTDITPGNFQWRNGIADTQVVFYPDPNGRFRLSWIPRMEYQNNKVKKGNVWYPGNKDMGAFGCDSYDISGVVGGGGSNGALHGLTNFSMDENIPSSHFFLEYISRPDTAEIFFEDVLMACVFYGMPILCENNKPRLLYHFKRRGYRGFSMNRPDKLTAHLSKTELEIGGIPNSSEDIKQAHAAAIQTYIEEHVGVNYETDTMGHVYFNRTLEDWVKFNISKRTAFDASISSGLAIMACNKFKYRPSHLIEVRKLNMGFNTFDQKGYESKIKQL